MSQLQAQLSDARHKCDVQAAAIAQLQALGSSSPGGGALGAAYLAGVDGTLHSQEPQGVAEASQVASLQRERAALKGCIAQLQSALGEAEAVTAVLRSQVRANKRNRAWLMMAQYRRSFPGE